MHVCCHRLQVRIAMSHALAQSAKLSVYEERVMELVDETKHLPLALAEAGAVKVSSKQVQGCATPPPVISPLPARPQPHDDHRPHST